MGGSKTEGQGFYFFREEARLVLRIPLKKYKCIFL